MCIRIPTISTVKITLNTNNYLSNGRQLTGTDLHTSDEPVKLSQ